MSDGLMPEPAHALLSPSSAYMWLECEAAVAVSQNLPDESSEYADDGTASHELMRWCLDNGADTTAYMGRVIKVGEREFEVDEERAEAVQIYADAVRGRVHAYELVGATVTLLVEQRLSIEHITTEPGGKGTSDTVIIAVWPDGRAVLDVWDLKYGRGVQVAAERNPQAMIYAAAAYEEHSSVYDFDEINIVISQPRVSEKPTEWRTTPAELIEWIDTTARPAAERAISHVTFHEHIDGGSNPEWFNPGEKQCRFCKAKATCPALAAHIEETLGSDFEALADVVANQDRVAHVVGSLAMLDNDRLGLIYESLDLIDIWTKAVRARIERELLEGHGVPGVKLVQGRKGARKWTDAESAESTLKSMRLKQDEMYNFKLISPTQAEKFLAKDSPRRWKKLELLVTQSPGSPSVAPDTDPRPALVIEPPANDFEVVTADDGSDLA